LKVNADALGVDYGQVLFGFNTRAEFGTNITEDLSGDDGLVYNPAIVWSLAVCCATRIKSQKSDC
jgi:hypothetical protein